MNWGSFFLGFFTYGVVELLLLILLITLLPTNKLVLLRRVADNLFILVAGWDRYNRVMSAINSSFDRNNPSDDEDDEEYVPEHDEEGHDFSGNVTR